MDILAKYVEYATEGTDAPTKYHHYAGAAAIGTIIGRRLWYKHGHTIIFPHLWVCLLGPSTWIKKSTSVGIASDLVQRFDEDLLKATKVSVEKLYMALADKPVGMMVFRELQVLLSMMGREFNVELKATLTDWYDSPYVTTYETFKNGTVHVRCPSLTVLAASTKEWLVEAAQARDIAGGFYPRWLYAHAETSDVEDKPLPAGSNARLRDNILWAIKNEIVKPNNIEGWQNETGGRMSFHPKAEAEYRRIYSSWRREFGADKLIAPFVGRGLTHIIKLAMISAQARSRSLQMSMADVQWAYEMVMGSIGDIKDICSYEIADSKTERAMMQVRSYIRKFSAEGVTRRTLLRSGPIRKGSFLDQILDDLRAAGYIQTIELDTGVHFVSCEFGPGDMSGEGQ